LQSAKLFLPSLLSTSEVAQVIPEATRTT